MSIIMRNKKYAIMIKSIESSFVVFLIYRSYKIRTR